MLGKQGRVYLKNRKKPLARPAQQPAARLASTSCKHAARGTGNMPQQQVEHLPLSSQLALFDLEKHPGFQSPSCPRQAGHSAGAWAPGQAERGARVARAVSLHRPTSPSLVGGGQGSHCGWKALCLHLRAAGPTGCSMAPGPRTASEVTSLRTRKSLENATATEGGAGPEQPPVSCSPFPKWDRHFSQ